MPKANEPAGQTRVELELELELEALQEAAPTGEVVLAGQFMQVVAPVLAW